MALSGASVAVSVFLPNSPHPRSLYNTNISTNNVLTMSISIPIIIPTLPITMPISIPIPIPITMSISILPISKFAPVVPGSKKESLVL